MFGACLLHVHTSLTMMTGNTSLQNTPLHWTASKSNGFELLTVCVNECQSMDLNTKKALGAPQALLAIPPQGLRSRRKKLWESGGKQQDDLVTILCVLSVTRSHYFSKEIKGGRRQAAGRSWGGRRGDRCHFADASCTIATGTGRGEGEAGGGGEAEC